ncbi:MAG: AAA family ATPase, partial [Candidatus Thiodiazotropha taylori]|nr:AAA family ATPase [Candidatus Thiodiazotropha taylori]MCW4308996.1 AAA family ATPase [Candidatus Thiodiazotropha endolucinida]
KAKKQEDRQKADFKASEIIHQRASKQNARQKPGVLEKEKAKKQEDRQKADFKASEIIHQRASKQNARQRPGVLAKERADKQEARQNSVFKANEVKYQRKSKQKARSNPFVLECERVKKQETRQQKQKLEAAHTVPNLYASSGTLQKQSSHQPVESIEECIKQFHLSISVGPLFVCTCCHQTWFRKSCSMLKNTHIPASSIRLYCTNLHSVHDEEWVCHTCLSALRESKVPRLSVANGMKWPEKPPELNLHQLEERLLALRIPFMQIRELPRGGQYSVKGNVINVPVDIQPTVKSLPRPMDENFTIAVQLKKKMAYKKVDFKENVRPLKVLAALHWLVNNSEFYKKFGFDIDENWYQNVTESAEDAVREFLDVPEQPNTSVSKENQEIEVDAATTSSSFKDCAVNDNYDSDEFSEIDANETVGNIDTLVDDANIENKYDKVFTFAPGEGQHPLSLYQDTDAEYLCFPSIFCGQRRPLNDERVVPVHYSDIVKWELRSVDRRAAQSVPNIFFKHKRLQMKQISDKVNLAVRRCKSKGKTITAAEARNPAYLDKLVNLDEGYYIFRQLRNSPAYLAARKKDIFAMIMQLGLPTWFMSLSAADTRWIDLLKMLAKLNDGIELTDKDIESLTWQEKTRLVQKDPVTCSRYFDHRVQEFLNIILKSTSEPIGKLKDFFYRVEFQQRGSPHIHMLVWVENAPFLEKNSEEEIVQFVDQYLTCSAENKETVHLVELQTHKHSRTCRKKGKAVCRFGFPLPPLPKTMLLYPLEENVEHYQKKYKELQKAMNEYKDDGEITFNDFLIEVAQRDFESYVKCIRSSLKVPKVFLKRKPSEMRVNMYNGNILLAWKANLDIQIVIEPYGCAAYVVGYISKSQRGMSAQLDAAAKEARNGNLNLKKQVRHIGNVFSNAVEVSAQEAVYLALQIPLTKCTRDVVFINTSTPEERVFLLKPKIILDELPAESKDIESDSVIQRYSKRPRQLQKLCLADYVSKVDVIYPKGNKLPERTEDKNDDSGRESDSSDETEDSDVELKYDHENPRPDLLCKTKNGTKYKYRKVPRVIRYVKYNRTKDPENYHREQLMLFMPWRNEQKDLLGLFETYTAHHDSMKALLEQKRNEYEHHTEELELARQMMEAEEASYDRLAPNAEQENREAQEEGVKDAEDFVYFNPERVTEHRHYDIGIEIQCTSSVQTEETTGFMMPDEEYLSLLRSLNLRQREFFNHVIHWMKCRDEPLYAFLSGGAGVGKSVVIRALYQCLYRILNMREGENPDETRILLCAYMGFAAYNINGKTIASAFHKKMFQSNQVMTADELNTFRIKYRHLKVVIIDEISMVGTRTLDFIDTRLQQLTGTRINFGGLSVIAVGDLYQLKPVGDPPLYVGLTEGASALAPNLWKEYFKMYELVDIMRQKDDLEFAHLLNRLRLNELTDTDLQTLHGRFVDQLDNYPKDALHIFAENSFVDEHNENVLNHLTEEKVIVQCHDTVVSSNIPQTECRNLIRKLPDVVSKTGNLQKNLTVAVGMIYVMTVNVYVEDGLTNGSTGVVKYIEYKMEGTNRPSVIWMLFDDPQIGKLTRQKYLQRGFYHSNIKQEWTPVFDVERTFMYKYKMYQRIQFPLRAAAAKTVHKAQGATVDQVVVDLSQTQTRRIPHIHYVALSRVKKLENLYIVNLNEATITLDEKVTEEMDRLRTNAVLELCYTPLYKIKPCKAKFAFNNTRSLHKHFQEIQFEPNILASDVVGFAETRLCARDEDMHFALNRFRLIRFDETACQSISRPHHGLAVYIKQNIEIEKIVKHRSHSCEFIMAALNSTTKGFYQYVVVYKYPKSSQADLKKDICSHLRPVVDISSKLVIMGDFNIQVNDLNCQFVKFMENTFQCHQNIKQPTTDAGSILDLIFSNDQVYSNTVEAYWTDHKLVYCVVD